jgi:hypothetical protein
MEDNIKKDVKKVSCDVGDGDNCLRIQYHSLVLTKLR